MAWQVQFWVAVWQLLRRILPQRNRTNRQQRLFGGGDDQRMEQRHRVVKGEGGGEVIAREAG